MPRKIVVFVSPRAICNIDNYDDFFKFVPAGGNNYHDDIAEKLMEVVDRHWNAPSIDHRMETETDILSDVKSTVEKKADRKRRDNAHASFIGRLESTKELDNDLFSAITYNAKLPKDQYDHLNSFIDAILNSSKPIQFYNTSLFKITMAVLKRHGVDIFLAPFAVSHSQQFEQDINLIHVKNQVIVKGLLSEFGDNHDIFANSKTIDLSALSTAQVYLTDTIVNENTDHYQFITASEDPAYYAELLIKVLLHEVGYSVLMSTIRTLQSKFKITDDELITEVNRYIREHNYSIIEMLYERRCIDLTKRVNKLVDTAVDGISIYLQRSGNSAINAKRAKFFLHWLTTTEYDMSPLDRYLILYALFTIPVTKILPSNAVSILPTNGAKLLAFQEVITRVMGFDYTSVLINAIAEQILNVLKFQPDDFTNAHLMALKNVLKIDPVIKMLHEYASSHEVATKLNNYYSTAHFLRKVDRIAEKVKDALKDKTSTELPAFTGEMSVKDKALKGLEDYITRPRTMSTLGFLNYFVSPTVGLGRSAFYVFLLKQAETEFQVNVILLAISSIENIGQNVQRHVLQALGYETQAEAKEYFLQVVRHALSQQVDDEFSRYEFLTTHHDQMDSNKVSPLNIEGEDSISESKKKLLAQKKSLLIENVLTPIINCANTISDDERKILISMQSQKSLNNNYRWDDALKTLLTFETKSEPLDVPDIDNLIGAKGLFALVNVEDSNKGEVLPSNKM